MQKCMNTVVASEHSMSAYAEGWLIPRGMEVVISLFPQEF